MMMQKKELKDHCGLKTKVAIIMTKIVFYVLISFRNYYFRKFNEIPLMFYVCHTCVLMNNCF